MTNKDLVDGHKYVIKEIKFGNGKCRGCVVELKNRELFFTGIHTCNKLCSERIVKDVWCFDLGSPKGESIEYREYLESMPITGHPMVIGEL